MGPWIWLVGLLACGGKDPEDTGADSSPEESGESARDTGETGPDTQEESGADTSDTAPVVLLGYTGFLGDASVDATSYVGTESWYFVEDEVDGGQDLCRITYTLTSTAVREDCADCTWAFDLVVSGAAVVAESGPGCLALSGYDAATVSALDGQVVSHGYNPDYFGHRAVLMMDTGGGDWRGVASADWTDGIFTYDRLDGTFEYEE